MTLVSQDEEDLYYCRVGYEDLVVIYYVTLVWYTVVRGFRVSEMKDFRTNLWSLHLLGNVRGVLITDYKHKPHESTILLQTKRRSNIFTLLNIGIFTKMVKNHCKNINNYVDRFHKGTSYLP